MARAGYCCVMVIKYHQNLRANQPETSKFLPGAQMKSVFRHSEYKFGELSLSLLNRVAFKNRIFFQRLYKGLSKIKKN